MILEDDLKNKEELNSIPTKKRNQINNRNQENYTTNYNFHPYHYHHKPKPPRNNQQIINKASPPTTQQPTMKKKKYNNEKLEPDPITKKHKQTIRRQGREPDLNQPDIHEKRGN